MGYAQYSVLYRKGQQFLSKYGVYCYKKMQDGQIENHINLNYLQLFKDKIYRKMF
jgi:hypothetical protein